MQTLALMSQKGGAGKSTLALHLAAEHVARTGERTLLLDLDPQGNLTGWAKRRGDRPPDVEAIHPSNLTSTLAEAEAEGYRLVIIDTAPSADRTAMAAAQAASFVLVPCRPAQFDLDAILATLTLCDALRRKYRVVLNAAPIRSRVVTDAAAVLENNGATVAPVIVRHRVAFQHCLADGRTARELEEQGAAAQEIAALYAYVTRCLHDDKLTTRSAA